MEYSLKWNNVKQSLDRLSKKLMLDHSCVNLGTIRIYKK